MCILVLKIFLEDMTIKDIVGFVIFHFFTIFLPFISLFKKFLIIGSLVFSETWHGVRDPYMVLRDSWI